MFQHVACSYCRSCFAFDRSMMWRDRCAQNSAKFNDGILPRFATGPLNLHLAITSEAWPVFPPPALLQPQLVQEDQTASLRSGSLLHLNTMMW